MQHNIRSKVGAAGIGAKQRGILCLSVHAPMRMPPPSFARTHAALAAAPLLTRMQYHHVPRAHACTLTHHACVRVGAYACMQARARRNTRTQRAATPSRHTPTPHSSRPPSLPNPAAVHPHSPAQKQHNRDPPTHTPHATYATSTASSAPATNCTHWVQTAHA